MTWRQCRYAAAASTSGNVLVVGQVAVSFLILVVAGLFVRSLSNSQQVPLGFDADRLPRSPPTRPTPATLGRGGPLLAQLRERIAGLPGVEAAALTVQLPVRGTGGSSTLVVEGYSPPSGTDSVEVLRSVVGPHYFETIGVPILHGRPFTQTTSRPTPTWPSSPRPSRGPTTEPRTRPGDASAARDRRLGSISSALRPTCRFAT